jgi:hypothetical protein
MIDDDLNSNKPFGHMCDGLEEWVNEDKSCVLGISENGHIYSCDADSNIPIKFCPFCGIKLE